MTTRKNLKKSLSYKDIVFRYAKDEELKFISSGFYDESQGKIMKNGIIGKLQLGYVDLLLTGYYTGEETSDERKKKITVSYKFTPALYNLRSSDKRVISVEEYLSTSKGEGGHISGWLEFIDPLIKNRYLHCTLNHEKTFGKDESGNNIRKLVYFPFKDCNNKISKIPCPYPFELNISKLINGIVKDKETDEDGKEYESVDKEKSFINLENVYQLKEIKPGKNSWQVIQPSEDTIKYAHLGSLMPHGFRNNCEINFIGDIDIPVLILEITDIEGLKSDARSIPNFILYDFALKHYGIMVYQDVYNPLPENRVIGIKRDQDKRDEAWKAKYLKYKKKYLQLKNRINKK